MMLSKNHINCPCGVIGPVKKEHYLIQCEECKTFQHIRCITELQSMYRYICPACQFLHFDFFLKVKRNILSARLIKGSSKSDTPNQFAFNLFHNTFTSLYNPDISFIVIHCIKFTKKGFTSSWPRNSIIKINGETLLNLKKNKKNFMKLNTPLIFAFNDEYVSHYNDYFPNNKHLIRQVSDIFADGSNKINVIISNQGVEKGDSCNFAVSIDFVEARDNISDIMKEINTIRDRKVLKKYMKIEYNEITQATKETVSLRDEYSDIDRIVYPGRGIECTHLKVFDIKRFLEMNKKAKRFRCPLRNKRVSKIYIDGNILDLMKKDINISKKRLILDFDYHQYEDNKEDEVDEEDVYDDKSEISDISQGEEERESESQTVQSGSYKKDEVIVIDDDEEVENINRNESVSSAIEQNSVSNNIAIEIDETDEEDIQNINAIEHVNILNSDLTEAELDILAVKGEEKTTMTNSIFQSLIDEQMNDLKYYKQFIDKITI